MKNLLAPSRLELEIAIEAIPSLKNSIAFNENAAEENEEDGNRYGASYFWTRAKMAETALQIMENVTAGNPVEEWEFDFAHAVKGGDYDLAQAIENEN